MVNRIIFINRSHLIGFQLTGQRCQRKESFTGIRALNANFENEKIPMVYYENKVATYNKVYWTSCSLSR